MTKPKTKTTTTFIKIFKNLSIQDKLLPLLILIAIIFGTLLSVYVPNSRNFMNGSTVVNVSIPVAVGLIVMMIPPLCKIEWENIHKIILLRSNLKQIGISLVLNWIVCPFIMFGLAWLTLFDKPEYRIGIIMIGLARCIAMVLVWNKIVGGSDELCALLVLINSLLQIVLYAPYQIFFCYVITGQSTSEVGLNVTYATSAKSVAFFLGVPMGFGILTRLLSLFTVGETFFNSKILPLISPFSLIGLLYTIIVIFIERGNEFIRDIGDAFRCFVPLVLYFMIVWFGTFFLMRYLDGRKTSSEELCGCEEYLLPAKSSINVSVQEVPGSPEISDIPEDKEAAEFNIPKKWGKKYCKSSYDKTITQTFTCSSNNFELSIAISIAIYGNGSKQAIAATFGPLLEVPILLLLCFLGVYFRYTFWWSDVDYSEYDKVLNEEEDNVVSS